MERYRQQDDGMRLDPGVRTRFAETRHQDHERRYDQIASAFESMMTPAGTNARRSQEDMIKQIMSGASGAWQQLLPIIMARMQQSKELYDRMSPSAMNMANQLSGAARTGRIDAFGAGANEAANRAAQQFGLQAKSQGWGDGATIGKSRSFVNSAARDTNRYAGWENSPQGMAANFGAVNQGLAPFLNWGSQDFNSLMGLGSLINGQQPVMVQPGLGQVVGQIAGDYVSAQTAPKAKK